MKDIVFATGNSRKIQEANETLSPYHITVSVQPVEIDEIQHHDPAEITKAKARSAYGALGKPVVVQDTSWNIPALGGFPGGYMKDVAHWFTTEDWLALMARHADRSIICLEHVAYFDGENIQHFEARYEGYFVDEPRGLDGNSLDKTVSLFDGKTMSEMQDEGKVASAAIELGHWKQFGEWYRHHEGV